MNIAFVSEMALINIVIRTLYFYYELINELGHSFLIGYFLISWESYSFL